MIRTVLAATIIALGVTTVVVAQGDPIAARQALMKANGTQFGIAKDMSDGKRPFDLAAAKKVFATFEESGEKAKALFPDNSKTGHDTEALPAIWENKADFDAKLTKFAADAKKAAAATTNLDTFKVQFAEVRQNCGGCHRTYRKKAS
jgi:cytochrome c556